MTNERKTQDKSGSEQGSTDKSSGGEGSPTGGGRQSGGGVPPRRTGTADEKGKIDGEGSSDSPMDPEDQAFIKKNT